MTKHSEGLPESLALAIDSYREAVLRNADGGRRELQGREDAALTRLCTALVLWRTEIRGGALREATDEAVRWREDGGNDAREIIARLQYME